MAATPKIVLFIISTVAWFSKRGVSALYFSAQKIMRRNPDGPYRSYLSQSLCTLAVCRGDMGDLKEALAAGEAVNVYRALAKASPGAYTSQLARSLSILSNRLIDAGKRAEALSPAKEAVKIRRAMAEANPKASNPDLALSLVNVFISLSLVGRRDEALAELQEAVEIRRALMKDNSKTFDEGLAVSLTNLALCLRDAGKVDKALDAIQEAERLFRVLVKDKRDAFILALLYA